MLVYIENSLDCVETCLFRLAGAFLDTLPCVCLQCSVECVGVCLYWSVR